MVVLGALASAGLMASLFHAGSDPSRVYYGTDTRLFDLMAGAVVAFLVAARPQPGPAARRALHLAGPAAAAALAVFWVTAGTVQGLPRNWMFDGGFLVCAVLAAVVVADARLLDRGVFARALSVRPLQFLGAISYGIYLWHWPIFVYLTGARTGLSQVPLCVVQVAATLAVATASYYLVEQPLRHARLRGAARLLLAPTAGLAVAVALVLATTPVLAEPTAVATVSPVPAGNRATGAGRAPARVVGSGGYATQRSIRLARGIVVTPRRPLRVMLLGDSVMHDASFGITAALSATGEVEVATNTIDGFGLVTASNWRTSIPHLIAIERPQLIIGTWCWDDDGPTTPNALHQPKQYSELLRSALRTMLRPGDGVDGVILLQFPSTGVIPSANAAAEASYDAERARGNAAWNAIAARMPARFPGRVMYLPLADSVLLDGRFASWLPPVGAPHAPNDRWVRVRKLDNVHLCPEGSARYALALLTDLTAIFRLRKAPAWSTGPWTSDADFNTPPGACPDDHPPS